MTKNQYSLLDSTLIMPNQPDIIERCEGYRIGDALYPILADAQKAALCQVMGCDKDASGVATIVAHREEVIKILSMEAPKVRKTRKDKGGKRTTKIAPVNPSAVGKP